MDIMEEIRQKNPVIDEELDLFFCAEQPRFREAENWILDLLLKNKKGDNMELPECVKILAGAMASLPDEYVCEGKAYSREEIIKSRFSYIGLLNLLFLGQ